MSAQKNLFDKVWELHSVGTLLSGQTQLFIGQHLIHEVTSPQAFEMLRDRKLTVPYPERTLATVDHIIPTDNQARPFLDTLAEDPEGTLMASPTNIAFCGRNRDILLSTNLGRWHITRYEAGTTGMPLEYPVLA